MSDPSQKTLVTFLLDRTGSMQSVKAQTIEGFNAYLQGLQSDPAGIEFSFLQFDSISLDVLCVSAPVAGVAPLTDQSYQPRASTPLIDAAVKTIRAVEAALAQRADRPKVVVTFQTDGQENASVEHGWAELNLLIKDKSAEGWQFNFLGAGIDAYEQGTRMGLAREAVMSYAKEDAAATSHAYRARAERTVAYARSRVADMAISPEEKAAAGDRFEPRPPPAPSAKPAGRPAARPAGQARRGLVDQPKL